MAGTTYVEGTDYWEVHDDSAWGYGPTSLFGLEWNAGHTPPADAAITLSGGASNTYNAVPRDVEDRIRRWRLVGTDARAHAAKAINLRLNLAVMFDQNYSRDQVEADVDRAVTTFFTTAGFDASIQASDILQTVHNVQGVDNVRFLTSSEAIEPGTFWGIEWVDSDGDRIDYIATGGRARDLYLGDNEVPVLHSINYVPKAANTFGVL